MTNMTPESVDVNVEGGSDRKRLVVGGGLVAALLLGAGGYMLMGSGSSDEESFSSPLAKKGVVAAPAAKKAAKPAAKPAAKVPVASSVKLGRDPFLALYTVPVAAPASTGTTPTTPTDTTTTPSGTDTKTATAPYSLILKSITGVEGKFYAFNVGGTAKTVVAGQKFGKYSELVTLAYVKSSKGAIIGALIQVGDDDPVTIKLGEKLTVL